ncbi:MAG: glycosyltransferase [Verrucomicrobia bacterium]|nr:glycosyltransferase [Verrucomicrobiota bacterium]
MESSRVPVVWLAYVSYPVTTAVYYERALRRNCRVVTCGPKIGPEVIKNWHLENMKLPVVDQDMPLPFEPDMRQVLPKARGRHPDPDLYLWIESVPGHFPKNLEAVSCPKACHLIDSHLNLEWHLKWAQLFDHVFVAQREYILEFRRQGCKNVHWLPLACDPEVHAQKTTQKRFDVGFVGSIFANTRRAELLQRLADKRLLLKAERCFWDEMALIFSQSRIVFNNAVRNDLNMRVFEAMSTGSFLLTDATPNSGQNELFVDGEDLGIYDDKSLLDKARFYLIHEEEREHIGRRGQAMMHKAHTYQHRAAEILRVCLHGQKTTPSAGEWRERSLGGLAASRKWKPRPPNRPRGRSFIIPILDASPKGRKEFEDLLNDLTAMDGEVVAVFNSPAAAEAFRNHPRIDLSASLNVNAGVPRAWNIGVHLATQPSLFFLNADLRVSISAVEALEAALWELPSAAVVGPEGSFFGFYTYEDILWLHKDSRPSSPQFVDAVSGFFFAAKRELFARKLLQFEDHYTPCFTEEWDLGIQVRQAGYKCYVVPVSDYSHEWGVSVQHSRVITYMKNEQGVTGEILARNRIRFWRKWLEVSGELALPGWEPNPPDPKPPTGSSLLQSRIVELTDLRTQKVKPPSEGGQST